MAGLVGKNILIVDEVDDTRTTLDYAVQELEKDVDAARQKLKEDDNGAEDKGPAKFSIFVLHVGCSQFYVSGMRGSRADRVAQNKDKPKKGHLPEDMTREDRYLAAQTVGDVWICYPWEAS